MPALVVRLVGSRHRPRYTRNRTESAPVTAPTRTQQDELHGTVRDSISGARQIKSSAAGVNCAAHMRPELSVAASHTVRENTHDNRTTRALLRRRPWIRRASHAHRARPSCLAAARRAALVDKLQLLDLVLLLSTSSTAPPGSRARLDEVEWILRAAARAR